MTKLEELNELRCRMADNVRNLGVMNAPTKPADRLQADAAYKLAMDAWQRAERAYADELAQTSSEELQRLARPHTEAPPADSP